MSPRLISATEKQVAHQKAMLQYWVCPDTIEVCGGGEVWCMMAEISRQEARKSFESRRNIHRMIRFFMWKILLWWC
jgi:hypothetical protein